MAFKMAPKSPALKKTNKFSEAAGKQLTSNQPGYGVTKRKEKSSAGDFEPAGKQKDFIPWAFRADNKLGGGSHSGVKGAMGSKTRKAEYDAKGWAYDETISKASTKKPKAKAVATIKPKGVVDVAPKQSTNAPVLEGSAGKAVKAKTKTASSPKISKFDAKTAELRKRGKGKRADRRDRRDDRKDARKAKLVKNGGEGSNVGKALRGVVKNAKKVEGVVKGVIQTAKSVTSGDISGAITSGNKVVKSLKKKKVVA